MRGKRREEEEKDAWQYGVLGTDRQTDVERHYEPQCDREEERRTWLGWASMEIEQAQETGLHLRCFLYLLAVLRVQHRRF